jgi:hypothetical protein
MAGRQDQEGPVVTPARLDFRPAGGVVSGRESIHVATGNGPLLVGHCVPLDGMAVLYRSPGRKGQVPLGHAGTVRGETAGQLRARVRARLLLGGPWWAGDAATAAGSEEKSEQH